MMKTQFKKYAPIVLGAAAGALAGYLYWHYVGCASGSCPITSSPLLSSLWGALFGALAVSLFERNPKKEQ